VVVDVLSVAAVRQARPKRLRELRLLGKASLARVRRGLSAIVPAAVTDGREPETGE
jgi:hypothetical protein